MLRRILSLCLVGGAIALSLACGGGGSDSTAATAVVSGTINDSSLSSKASLKSGETYTAKVTNLDNAAQTWTVTVNADRTYSATVLASINIKIEVLSGDTVILSKVMDKASVSGAVAAVEINAVTHVESKMVISSYAGGGDVLTSLKSVRTEMFGADTVPNYSLRTALGNLSTTNNFAAMVNTYAQMIGTITVGAQSSELTALADTFGSGTLTGVATKINTYIQQADSTRLTIFATAQNGAQTAGLVAASVFNAATTALGQINTSFRALVESTSVLTPAFGSAGDRLRKAAPGVLFQYTFPGAVSPSGLGISGVSYSGTWTSSSSPSGITNGPSGASPILKFIPSQSDVGTTFQYTLTATAPNGRTVTNVISIPVTALEIAQGPTFALSDSSYSYYKPVLGPISGGDYFYVVANVSSMASHVIQKYRKSDLDGSALSVVDSATLPSGFTPTNMLVSGQYGYLTSQNSGLTSIDLSSLGSSSIATPAAFTGTQLAVAQGSIYGLDTTNTATVKYATLRSSTASDALSLSSISSTPVSMITTIGSYNNYLYVAGNYTGVFTTATAGTAWTQSFTPTGYNFVKDQSMLTGAPLYLASNYTDSVKALTLTTALSPVLTTLTGVTTQNPGEYANAVNGSVMFGIDDMSSAYGYSLMGAANSTTVTGSTGVVSFTNADDITAGIIVNKPEGLATGATVSGGRYLVLGQTATTGITSYSATMTGTW